jgi:hypothetical protein
MNETGEYELITQSDKPIFSDEELKSIRASLTLRQQKKFDNRIKWKQFSRCKICKAVLTHYVYDHTFEETVQKLHEKHPNIKCIREYTRNAIRSALGEGIFDDTIIAWDLWPARDPILASTPEIKERLRQIWQEREFLGGEYIRLNKNADKLASGKGKSSEAFRYAFSRANFQWVGKKAVPHVP